jgi:Holliday junction DNA helicase RuvA
MIASIEGTVGAALNDGMVIAVNGLGYRVFTPPSAIREAGESVMLHTTLIVREDSLTLFGFPSPADRDLFDLLLTISGVGPKVALSILSTLNADHLRNAVVADRAEILTRVPGIGKKTAQKILFELKDKLPKGLADAPVTLYDDVNSDVIDTLVALGYSIVEAQTAVQAMPADAPQDVEERVRLALQYFA